MTTSPGAAACGHLADRTVQPVRSRCLAGVGRGTRFRPAGGRSSPMPRPRSRARRGRRESSPARPLPPGRCQPAGGRCCSRVSRARRRRRRPTHLSFRARSGPSSCRREVTSAARPEGHVSLLQVGDERRDHAAEPSQQPEKQRLAAPAPATVRLGRAGQHGPERTHHASLTDEVLCDLRCYDRERQLVGAAGVDPAEQRVDETPDDLVAEPTLEDRGGCPLRLAGVVRAGQAAGALPGPPGGLPAAASIGRGSPTLEARIGAPVATRSRAARATPVRAHDP